MKKKITIISMLLLLVFIGIGYIYMSKPFNPLKDIEIENVKEIYIADSSSNYIVTEMEDKKEILEALKDMKLYRSFGNKNAKGFSFMIDIIYMDGKTTYINFDEPIRINDSYYKSDVNYDSVIRKIYDKLGDKYKRNPA